MVSLSSVLACAFFVNTSTVKVDMLDYQVHGHVHYMCSFHPPQWMVSFMIELFGCHP